MESKGSKTFKSVFSDFTENPNKIWNKPNANEINDIKYLQIILKGVINKVRIKNEKSILKPKMFFLTKEYLYYTKVDTQKDIEAVCKISWILIEHDTFKIDEKKMYTLKILKKFIFDELVFNEKKDFDIWYIKLRKFCINKSFNFDYRVDSEIKANSQFTIYMIVDIKNDKKKAAKSISKSDLCKIPKLFDKLVNEIVTLRDLNHNNIIILESVYETDKSIFLIMELCQGGPVINQGGFTGKLIIEQVNIILISMLSVLQHIHEKGYVYRDLKPENIVVVNKEPLTTIGQIRLISFGSSCRFEDAISSDSKVGTLGYIAPEQLDDDYKYKDIQSIKSTDIFSLGSTLFKQITSKLPFNNSSALQLLTSNQRCEVNWRELEILCKKQKIRDDLIDMQKQMMYKDYSLRQSINCIFESCYIQSLRAINSDFYRISVHLGNHAQQQVLCDENLIEGKEESVNDNLGIDLDKIGSLESNEMISESSSLMIARKFSSASYDNLSRNDLNDTECLQYEEDLLKQWSKRFINDNDQIEYNERDEYIPKSVCKTHFSNQQKKVQSLMPNNQLMLKKKIPLQKIQQKLLENDNASILNLDESNSYDDDQDFINIEIKKQETCSANRLSYYSITPKSLLGNTSLIYNEYLKTSKKPSDQGLIEESVREIINMFTSKDKNIFNLSQSEIKNDPKLENVELNDYMFDRSYTKNLLQFIEMNGEVKKFNSQKAIDKEEQIGIMMNKYSKSGNNSPGRFNKDLGIKSYGNKLSDLSSYNLIREAPELENNSCNDSFDMIDDDIPDEMSSED